MIKKQATSYEDIGQLHYYSAVTSKSLAQKKFDPTVSTISFTIGTSRLVRALYDLGASMNLMSLDVFK